MTAKKRREGLTLLVFEGLHDHLKLVKVLDQESLRSGSSLVFRPKFRDLLCLCTPSQQLVAKVMHRILTIEQKKMPKKNLPAIS